MAFIEFKNIGKKYAGAEKKSWTRSLPVLPAMKPCSMA